MNINNLSVDLLKIEKKQNKPSYTDWHIETPPELAPWAYFNNFLSKEECDYIIEYGTEIVSAEKAKVGQNQLDETIRKTEISWMHPCSETTWLYKRLTDVICGLNNDYFKFDLIGFKEPLQFSKYSEGYGHYKPHVDLINNNIYQRKLSFSVNLVDERDYDGGDLEMHLGDDPQILPRDLGMLKVFPSYSLHAVTPVTRGCRYTLVGWMRGENFK